MKGVQGLRSFLQFNYIEIAFFRLAAAVFAEAGQNLDWAGGLGHSVVI